MKKLFTLLLFGLLPLVANAAEHHEIDLVFYSLSSDGTNTATVIKNPYGYYGDVFIHDIVWYGDVPYSVTSISDNAFAGCTGLTSVIIPIGVTSIGDYAFSGCTGLTSVTIPFSVTSIGRSAFKGCKGLTSVTIDDIVSPIGNILTSIGDNAFAGCTGLTSITIPNSVTSIGTYAFAECSGLTSVTIGTGVTSIGSNAFWFCSGLTSVTIPNSVTSIAESTFSGCRGLTSVTIPSSVTSIGTYAFAECSGLTSVHISDIAAWCKISFSSYESNPLYYAHHLFLNGEEIFDLVIPSSVTSIGNYAFLGCTGLTSVTIPNSVSTICKRAFSHCSGLTSVTIPNSVTNIGDGAFNDCSGLTSVTIPNSVTSIDINTFGGCSCLTSVTIPNSVTSIGGSAFSGCTGLTSVTIPNSVTSIGGYAFYNCSSLTSVTIPNGVISIEEETFKYCRSLSSVTIPNSVTSIGHSAFWECTSLNSVTIPNSVTSIGDFAFYDCDGLTSVTIGTGVTTIGNRAFSNCNSLTSVTIGNSVTSIGEHAFRNCWRLASVTIPNSVTSIGEYAFRDCWRLTSVTIGNSVTSIGDFAFHDCHSLTSVTIPNSVTSIGHWAFQYCSGLTSVTIGNSMTSIGYEAFSHCSSLTDFYCYAENVPETEADAFNEANIANATLHVPAGSVEDYNSTEPWSGFGTIVAIGDNPSAYVEYYDGTLTFYYDNLRNSRKGTTYNLNKGTDTPLWNTNSKTINKVVFDSSFANARPTSTFDWFLGCNSLEKIEGITYLNTSSVTNMGCMFKDCSSLTSVDLSHFNTTNVTNMALMFWGCSTLTSLDLSSFDTGNNGSVGSMFNGCSNLSSLTLGTLFTTTESTITDFVFLNCTSLKTIIYTGDIPTSINDNFFQFVGTNDSPATLVVPEQYRSNYAKKMQTNSYVSYFYGGCFKLSGGDDNPPVVDGDPYIVYNDGTLSFFCDDQRSSRQGTTYDLNTGITIPGWSEHKEDIMKVVFDKTFANARPTSTNNWFAGCNSLTTIEGISNLNTSEVTDMYSMFDECHNLKSIDLSGFNTEKVTTMGQMFYNCRSLTELDLSSFDTQNVTFMGFMFFGCYNLTSLDVSKFNTIHVTGMRMMFYNCNSLKTLNVSNFDTRSVKDMSALFSYCGGLQSIDVSKFDTKNVENMGEMFKYCESLTSLDLSNFDTRNLKDINYGEWINYGVESMFIGCGQLTQIVFGEAFATNNNLSCNNVFSGCENLNKVVFTGDIPASINSKFFTGVGTADNPATLAVPEEYMSNYRAKFDGNLFYGGYFTLSDNGTADMKDGDIFVYKTAEGVEMTFKVISAADKTCQLGDGTKACIDTSTSGSFTIPAEVNGLKVISVASWALYGCYGLNEIVISEGVESLMDNSIEQCNGVTSFVLPASVTSLSNTFGGVSSCMKSIKVAEGNPVYDSRNNCNAIIETATNVLRDGCVNTVIPSTVTAIGDWAMCNKNLTSISIPNNVKSIGEGALRYNLFKTVIIPESIEYIGYLAFEECWYLENVTIVSKKCRLSHSSFASCGKLKTVVSYIENPEAITGTIFYNSYVSSTEERILNDDVILYVPFGTKATYEATDGWKNFKNIVEMNATVGDVTGDGEVTKEDIFEVEAEIIQPSEEFNPNKDVNRDGVVNVIDIVVGNKIRNSQEQAK